MVSLLGAFSAILILSEEDNLQIDFDNADFNFNESTLETNFSLPFQINNTGYFDIENLDLYLEIFLNYSSISHMNETVAIKIFNKTQPLGDIPKGDIGDFVFFGNTTDFYYPLWILPDINWLRLPHIFEFYANITISLDYSIGLHSLAITLENYFVEGYP
jgi:hypothetical protein